MENRADLMQRPNYLDLAKDIMIYMVVLGHYAIALEIPFEKGSLWNVTHMVTLFHMPFFFMISGMLFKYQDIKTTIKKGWKQLLVPYFLMSFICLIIMSIHDLIGGGGFSISKTAHIIIGIISGSDCKWGHDPYADPLWFCYSLFIIKIVASLCGDCKTRKGLINYVFVCILGVIFVLKGIRTQFRIDSSLVGFIFFAGGLCFKEDIMNVFNNLRSTVYVISISCVVLLISGYFNLDFNSIKGGLSINVMRFGPYPLLFIISGFAGSLMMIGLCRLVGVFKMKLVRKQMLAISNGTIIILGFHWLFFLLCFKPWCHYSSIIMGLLISLFNLLLCVVIIFLSSKYFPILLGNRNLK